MNRVVTSRLVLRTMPWGMVAQQKVKHKIKDVTTYLTGAEMLRKNSQRWKSIKGSKRCAVVCLGCVSPSDSALLGGWRIGIGPRYQYATLLMESMGKPRCDEHSHEVCDSGTKTDKHPVRITEAKNAELYFCEAKQHMKCM